MKLEGFSNYEIYPETGQVFSYKRNRFVGSIGTKGYVQCGLTDDDGVQHFWQTHRLIWTAVNGEIPDGMEINHIDENVENNSITNLSLMTHKENINWGTRNDKISKPILGLNENKIVYYFKSLREAERNGFVCQCISNCCKRKRPHHKGYQWKYLEDQLADWLEEIQDEDMKNERVA